MGGKTFDFTYPAPVDAVFPATVRAVGELGYAITFASAEARVVTFNTGRSSRTWAGQDLTATLLSESDGTRVVIGGSLATRGSPWGGGSQLVGWGEKADLAELVLDTIAEMLAESGEVSLEGLSDEELEGLSDEDAAQLAEIKRQFEQGRLTATDYQALRSYLGVRPD